MADVDLLSPRQMNRLRLIEALYRHPGSCRAELARLTGLSRPTVSALVEELERAGVVERAAAGGEERGRSAGLSLVPRAAFAVGLDFGHDQIRVAVCDLAGEPVFDDWSSAEVDHAPVESLDLAHELVRTALRDAGVKRDCVLGVGMGIAAPIDRRTGSVFAAGILPGWGDIRPSAEMEARLGLPVQLENDANVGALGEKAFGAGRGVEDLVYVRLSTGIGAGLILSGRPFRGVRGVAGEIGHVPTADNGLVCRCGSRGCLETVASPVAIAALLERSLGRPMSVARLLGLVAAGDRGVRRVIADAGDAVGRALATVVNVVNPELVIVGGELAGAGEVLLDPLRAAIERHAIPPAADAVEVTLGALGPRAEVLGAAALILAQSPRALVQRVGDA